MINRTHADEIHLSKQEIIRSSSEFPLPQLQLYELFIPQLIRINTIPPYTIKNSQLIALSTLSN